MRERVMYLTEEDHSEAAKVTIILLLYIQWNLDTIGPDYNVLNSEVSLIQRLLSTQMWHLKVS